MLRAVEMIKIRLVSGKKNTHEFKRYDMKLALLLRSTTLERCINFGSYRGSKNFVACQTQMESVAIA
jgi:hypothetical protein